ncbi:MAG: site-specific DNA-methyltransferase [Paludibacteraceae bacterium]|nr:site-specific DNA-methyltransferase [Paludibacteraceae bacterium]
MTVKNNSNNDSIVETHGRASLPSDTPSTADLQIKIRELEKEIARLHGQIKEQRYVLTWLDVPEAFETESENKIPILEEVKEKAIDAAGRDTLNASANNTPPHVIIEGDNYHALTCLNYTHRGKIDVIYIDPPYNTGSDGFTYKDKRFLKEFPDGSPVPKEHPLRHSYWLSFMSKRLELAKNLLSDKGVIFISIDDNELANLKLLCDKGFGEENFVAKFDWRKKTGANDAKDIAVITESILTFAKNKKATIDLNGWNRDESSRNDNRFKLTDEYVSIRGKYYLDTLDRGGLQYSDSMNFGIKAPDGGVIFPNGRAKYVNDGWIWKWGKEKIQWGIENGFVEFVKSSKSKGSKYTIKYKVYQYVDNEGNIKEKIGRAYTNLITEPINQQGNADITDLFSVCVFSNPKPVGLICYLLNTIVNKQSTILDFFAGSGTTLHATMKLNAEDGGHRQCILVQQKEGDNNICENVTYERNRRVMCGYTNAKGEEVEGLGGRLKYYRTAFVGKNTSREATDADRVELALKAGYLLALGENTLEEICHTDSYQFFADVPDGKKPQKITAIFFTENYIKMPEFVAEIERLRMDNTDVPTQFSVYIFCWGEPDIFEGEFDDLRNISLKAIPQPILDVYKSINQ